MATALEVLFDEFRALLDEYMLLPEGNKKQEKWKEMNTISKAIKRAQEYKRKEFLERR